MTDQTLHLSPVAPSIDTSTWAVPVHEVAKYGPKAHAHVLVIPVLNEGERIRGQLRRIAALAPAVDVVIADGGSTDGALDPTFVQEVGLRAVLTKIGPGKLSAQLRMAYAWCLEQGYEGIITVDGNGKDGMEFIPDFSVRLGEGYDYIQGSRYRDGGGHDNTPLERTVGNRIVHAPILSLAGRHWLTDTTNGYRGYSARYLLDPRVQPFREVFQAYELLFYLTVRAGQIGMRVIEIPVTRKYPKGEPTPTKINGLAGKVRLFKQTIAAATGRFAPPR